MTFVVGADPDREHRLGQPAVLLRGISQTISVTVAAISSAEAIAVCTFITRTASLPGSASNTSSAAA